MLLWHAAAMRLPCPDPKLSDPRSDSPLSAPVKVTPKALLSVTFVTLSGVCA